MSLFESRERAFEARFVQEEDLRFRACAVRNRKLAIWAGERLALRAGEQAAHELFIVQLGAFYGDPGVRERLLHDLDKAGKPISEHRIRRMMDEGLAAEITVTAGARATLMQH